jgi:hypothetical protein
MRRLYNAMFNGNAFKLGLISPNCSGGMAATTVPERWDASWANNLRLAQMADAAGIEFLLPIARWTGYGGVTDFSGQLPRDHSPGPAACWRRRSASRSSRRPIPRSRTR